MSEEDLREIEENFEEEVPPKSYLEYSYYFGDLDTGEAEKIYINVPVMPYISIRQSLTPQLHMKGYISVFNDILEEITVMKCVMNEIQEDNWNELIQYQTLSHR